MWKLYEIFKILQIQKRTVSSETIRGSMAFGKLINKGSDSRTPPTTTLIFIQKNYLIFYPQTLNSTTNIATT